MGISFIATGGTQTQLPDQKLIFKSDADNATAAMSSGSLATLSQNLSFTHIEFTASSYDHGITISDVVLQLRDIVGLSTRHGCDTPGAAGYMTHRLARAAPFFGCFIGTLSPSRRHRRSTRLSFTCQPAPLSNAVTRR